MTDPSTLQIAGFASAMYESNEFSQDAMNEIDLIIDELKPLQEAGNHSSDQFEKLFARVLEFETEKKKVERYLQKYAQMIQWYQRKQHDFKGITAFQKERGGDIFRIRNKYFLSVISLWKFHMNICRDINTSLGTILRNNQQRQMFVSRQASRLTSLMVRYHTASLHRLYQLHAQQVFAPTQSYNHIKQTGFFTTTDPDGPPEPPAPTLTLIPGALLDPATYKKTSTDIYQPRLQTYSTVAQSPHPASPKASLSHQNEPHNDYVEIKKNTYGIPQAPAAPSVPDDYTGEVVGGDGNNPFADFDDERDHQFFQQEPLQHQQSSSLKDSQTNPPSYNQNDTQQQPQPTSPNSQNGAPSVPKRRAAPAPGPAQSANSPLPPPSVLPDINLDIDPKYSPLPTPAPLPDTPDYSATSAPILVSPSFNWSDPFPTITVRFFPFHPHPVSVNTTVASKPIPNKVKQQFEQYTFLGGVNEIVMRTRKVAPPGPLPTNTTVALITRATKRSKIGKDVTGDLIYTKTHQIRFIQDKPKNTANNTNKNVHTTSTVTGYQENMINPSAQQGQAKPQYADNGINNDDGDYDSFIKTWGDKSLTEWAIDGCYVIARYSKKDSHRIIFKEHPPGTFSRNHEFKLFLNQRDDVVKWVKFVNEHNRFGPPEEQQ